MDCLESKKLMERYLEDKVSAGDRRLIEEHLKGCTVCQNYCKAVRDKILPYKRAYVYPVDKNYPSNLPQTNIPAIRKPKERWWKALIPNILTALSLIFIIIGLLIAQRILTR